MEPSQPRAVFHGEIVNSAAIEDLLYAVFFVWLFFFSHITLKRQSLFPKTSILVTGTRQSDEC